ncbi:MAG: hypothetical protein BWY74_04487 [Firmicutes bacterium ADurb.Bin419]|nr:MAG: hypothetical protein BWY74_04487 [Firmicutes bacterium ADurb.Bin419]
MKIKTDQWSRDEINEVAKQYKFEENEFRELGKNQWKPILDGVIDKFIRKTICPITLIYELEIIY